MAEKGEQDNSGSQGITILTLTLLKGQVAFNAASERPAQRVPICENAGLAQCRPLGKTVDTLANPGQRKGSGSENADWESCFQVVSFTHCSW